MFGELKEQFKRVLPDAIFELIRLQKDYSAIVQEPKAGKYFKGSQGRGAYLKRLEDIDVSWIESYFTDMLTGIKINRDDSISAYENSTRIKSLFKDSESGALSDPSDYTEEKSDYTMNEVLKWKEKLPYILKRLHERSKEININLLSFVFAYERAVKEAVANKKNNNDDLSVGAQSIIDNDIYAMNPNGTVGLALKENNHKPHKYLRWIRGLEEHDEYFENVLELGYIAERLGIDLAKESAFDYQEDFINSLVVTYITSNKQIGKRINNEVLTGLRGLNIKDFGASKVTARNNATTFDDMCRVKVNQFLNSIVKDIADFRDSRNVHNEMTFLVRQLSYCAKASEKIETRTPVCDGFYMIDRGTYLTVDVAIICNVMADKTKKTRLKMYRAAVHSSGFLVLITGGLSMYYLDYRKATDYMTDVYNNTVSEYTRYENNTKFGTWGEARI